ncbi:hypothetical protein LTR78_003638 [Recurvomyces mirabilis]|uniref:Nuclease PA3 n=1 Tax=Recurvomyces mirabilis TaxID=574656 RepID=A0AAE1C3G2_9PEZI|nr:hypothetical protein LTR78_003638 [Recurvomyces mirabilis]KAK5154751.1 hypothetical protein LTS14_006331 [Recurvomyces mirabilis]
MYSLALTTLIAAHGVNAWGTLGHETVAYIAQDFVQSATKTWAQSILGDTSTSYLANVATWADTYRYTTAGAFSAPYHFIDAEDSPPSSCSVNYNRDCGAKGCSVSAIANYTSRLQISSLSAGEITNALKFIVHFVGDITQPLHDEALEWDTNMPEQLRGGYALSDARTWATNLTTEIKTGIYKSRASSWVSGLNINDAVDTAMTWASDANAYVCTTVLPKGQSAVESGDLYPKYYNSAVPTIEIQIAKAGYRLAKWLDAIAATQSKNKRAALVERRVQPVQGNELLVGVSQEMTPAKLRRAAIGWGCGHKH